jgi:hypothetical protein
MKKLFYSKEDQELHMNNIDALIETLRSGSFARTGYSVTINLNKLERFMRSVMLYTDYNNHESKENILVADFFSRAVPEFQRTNDKWSESMQIKFVENLFAGCPTEIKLFRVMCKSDNQDAQIIDGLQRLTAIFDFMQGKFPIFGFSYDDIKDKISSFHSRITLSVYDFDSWAGAGKYYIDMNENITHSPADIQKAKTWFLETHGVVL